MRLALLGPMQKDLQQAGGYPFLLLIVFYFLVAVDHHRDKGFHGPEENVGQVMGLNVLPEAPGLLAARP